MEEGSTPLFAPEDGGSPSASSEAAAAAAAAAAEPKSYAELVGRTWKLALAAFILMVHKDIDFQLFQPYFFSRVECCGLNGGPMLEDVTQYGGHDVDLKVTAHECDCNLTATYPGAAVRNDTVGVPAFIAACEVPFISPDDALWSHSANCANWPYVRMQAQTLTSGWYSIMTLVFVILMPIFGRLSDLYGRRQVFYYTTVMSMVAFAIFTADSAVQLTSDWAVYLTAPLLTASFVTEVVAWSMAADLVPDAQDQARIFPVLMVIFSGKLPATLGVSCHDITLLASGLHSSKSASNIVADRTWRATSCCSCT